MGNLNELIHRGKGGLDFDNPPKDEKRNSKTQLQMSKKGSPPIRSNKGKRTFKPKKKEFQAPTWLESLVRVSSSMGAVFLGIGISLLAFVGMIIWAGQGYMKNKESTDAILALVGAIGMSVIGFAIAGVVLYIVFNGYQDYVHKGKKDLVTGYIKLSSWALLGYAVITVFIWGALLRPTVNGGNPVGEVAAGIYDTVIQEKDNSRTKAGFVTD